MPELTPMMRQYVRIKEEHPDAFLFFRLGDFYEMFRNDAVEASRLLGLTLTSRQGVPMCGVPHHAATGYIARLIAQGRRVAICEQVSVPDGKGLAEREVVEVITPGTVTQDDYLPDSNNFLICLAGDNHGRYLAYLDVSTGELGILELPRTEPWLSLRRELARLEPREALVQQSMMEDPQAAELLNGSDILLAPYPDWEFDLESSRRLLGETLGVSNLKAFGVDDESHLPLPVGVLLGYVRDTARGPLRHVTDLTVLNREPNVGLDESTIRNLELVANMHDNSSRYSLLETLKETRTSMGTRLLRRWILSPLADSKRIAARQRQVSELHRSQRTLGIVRERLGTMLDLERLTARLSMGRAHAKDLVAVRTTVEAALGLREYLVEQHADGIAIVEEIDAQTQERCAALAELLGRSLVDEPPTTYTDGGVIREGFDAELDRLRDVRDNSRGVLEAYVLEERERTGINTIRVRENRMLGHFLELSRAAADRVPDYFIRRQSLANSERFTTERLSEIESEINEASERIMDLERDLFLEVRAQAEEQTGSLLKVARALARLDTLQSLAHAATLRGYTAPVVSDSLTLEITAGRHPVVEAHLPSGAFVPNDTSLDRASNPFALITGPNMAGKSTYLRQNALIVLMAQIGSYVPADEAHIGIVDRIFCRVGASDNLARGESTFLVEMNEAAYILRSSTRGSLVIMDEIGRGTGTNDGLAIARAIMEHIAGTTRPRTLFATHYHELTALEIPGVKNLSLRVAEEGNEIVFLKRIEEGPSNNSYGLHVARLAGVPRSVLERAEVILQELIEMKESRGGPVTPARPVPEPQASLFNPMELIAAELRELDVDSLRPIDALTRLARWQDEVRAIEEERER